jgi:hypothetical protein
LAQSGATLFLQLMPNAAQGPSAAIQASLVEIAQASNKNRHDFRIILDTDKLFIPWGFVFSGSMHDVPSNQRCR